MHWGAVKAGVNLNRTHQEFLCTRGFEDICYTNISVSLCKQRNVQKTILLSFTIYFMFLSKHFNIFSGAIRNKQSITIFDVFVNKPNEN